MLKKILIGVGVVVVLLGAAFGYLQYRNYSLSPRGTAELENGGLEIMVDYCRPSVRDRVIFGTAEEGALQPYGQYWRLGANEATEIEFKQDVLLVDQEIKKGRYRLYAIPGEYYFDLVLNSSFGWGAFEPDSTQDVATVKVPVLKGDFTEQFTISLEPLYDNSQKLVIKWAETKLEVPIIAN